MKNFKVIVEYDGTDYFGWQRQKHLPSIQGEIEKHLSIILNQTISIHGSGRTDAGVHSIGQTASFHASTGLTCQDIKRGFNSIIKQPIVVTDCSLADLDFHAQYDAVSKEYHYYILNRDYPKAVGRNYCWHVKNPLNLERMKSCCKIINGEHDFKSFEGVGSPRSNTVREILDADINYNRSSMLIFKITATGFLKYMVRNILGTLVLAGHLKITVDDFKKILESKNRTNAGPTAPPQGLFLMKVNY